MPSRIGVKRFGILGKLSLRFVGTFEILQRVGEVAYGIDLLPSLARVHNVFHVSMLRKFIRDLVQAIGLEPSELKEDLTYKEQPKCVVDKKEQVLRLQLKNHLERDANWELEEEMRQKYP
ncbi:uncharacterized protein LOC109832426 [Asparagus officinalis]|uniref:uncharacterized protein LOC109832426 n=1 Tax=Asparagus officinalis TaxID=4686 RepID=UPI00098E2CA6|nr:uncharacterized protein LOC109832426 [Asparagus officinalis]